MTAFDSAFDITVGHEGGYGADPRDKGNWTGGEVGKGTLGGTKYGQASSSYADSLAKLPADVRATFPATVKDLTLDQVKTIYKAIYWDANRCDDLPPALAALVFDADINNGDGNGARFLQRAVDAKADGQIGATTVAAVKATVARNGLDALCAEFQAQRVLFMSSLPTWRTYGLGWSRRLCRLPYQVMRLASAPAQ